jgi:hypothetical protein
MPPKCSQLARADFTAVLLPLLVFRCAADWPLRDVKFRVDSARKSLVRLQRQQDAEGQELAEAVAQKTPLQQSAHLKHAFFHSEVLKKRTCALHESLKRRFKVENGAWHRQRKQQQ